MVTIAARRPLLDPWRNPSGLPAGPSTIDARLRSAERSPMRLPPILTPPGRKPIKTPITPILTALKYLWAAVELDPPNNFWRLDPPWSLKGSHDVGTQGVYQLVVRGDDLVYLNNNSFSDFNLYLSEDRAATWTPIPFPEATPDFGPWYEIQVNSVGRYWLFGNDVGANLWYTDDKFQTYGQKTIPIFPVNLAIHPTDPLKIAYGYRAGAVISLDGGDTWELHNASLETPDNFHVAAWLGDELIVVGEQYNLGTNQNLFWYKWSNGSWTSPVQFVGPINAPGSQLSIDSGINSAWCSFNHGVTQVFRMNGITVEEVAVPLSSAGSHFGKTAALGTDLYMVFANTLFPSPELTIFKLTNADTIDAGSAVWEQDPVVIYAEALAVG